MARKALLETAAQVEAAEGLGFEVAADALHGLRAAFPKQETDGHLPEGVVTSTDGLVALVNAALPGWHFSIHGRARPGAGRWTCSLRRSDVLDDDEIVGTGEAVTLSQAVLAAVLRVAAWR